MPSPAARPGLSKCAANAGLMRLPWSASQTIGIAHTQLERGEHAGQGHRPAARDVHHELERDEPDEDAEEHREPEVGECGAGERDLAARIASRG